MYKTPLCLGTFPPACRSIKEQLRLFRETGFEGFFTGWDDDLKAIRRQADKLGLLYQSVHAPFTNAADMWKTGSDAEAAVEELLRCVKDCAAVEVPILVVHTWIGFEPSAGPSAAGIENFRRVVDEAAKRNVKIAFENTEGEEYLAALLDTFADDPAVGFCWDTGHELCYNRGRDLTALYGEKLICTHLNDNLGVRDLTGEITWLDDLHLLPFDGITDWQGVADRLVRCGYRGPLTFELNLGSKPGRRDNDKYARMDFADYVTEVYARACRIAAMYQRAGIKMI